MFFLRRYAKNFHHDSLFLGEAATASPSLPARHFSEFLFFFCFSKSSIFFFAASQINFYATVICFARELILFCLEVTSIVTALVRLGLQLIKRDDLSFVPRILCSPFRGHMPNWMCLQPYSLCSERIFSRNNTWFRSDEELTLETSALETFWTSCLTTLTAGGWSSRLAPRFSLGISSLEGWCLTPEDTLIFGSFNQLELAL